MHRAPSALLLLDLQTSSWNLARLARWGGALLAGPRAVAIPLAGRSAEEVLSLCVALGIGVRRSRVIRVRTAGSGPGPATRGTH